MAESPDFDEGAGIAVSLAGTDLSATGLAKEATTSKDTSVQGISGQGGWPTSGLAKETGGNLDTHTRLLSGTQAGALLGTIGNTLAYEIASMLANGNNTGIAGGIPANHGHSQLYISGAQVLPVSGSFTTPVISFTRGSYIMHLTAIMSGTNAHVPSVRVNITWRSSGSGNTTVDQQLWYIPAGGSSTQRSIIKGPVVGDEVIITLVNGDATDTCTVNLNVYETNWPSTRHDGRSSSNVGLFGATGFNDDAAALVLANDSFTVPASSTTIKTMALYAGQVNIWLNQNAGAGSQVSIVPTGDFTGGVSNPIASLDWTAPPHQQISVILPRAWCTAQFTNNAAAPVIATIGITALEFAS